MHFLIFYMNLKKLGSYLHFFRTFKANAAKTAKKNLENIFFLIQFYSQLRVWILHYLKIDQNRFTLMYIHVLTIYMDSLYNCTYFPFSTYFFKECCKSATRYNDTSVASNNERVAKKSSMRL